MTYLCLDHGGDRDIPNLNGFTGSQVLSVLTFVSTSEVLDKIWGPSAVLELEFLWTQLTYDIVDTIGELLWLLEMIPALSIVDLLLRRRQVVIHDDLFIDFDLFFDALFFNLVIWCNRGFSCSRFFLFLLIRFDSRFLASCGNTMHIPKVSNGTMKLQT